MKRREPAFMVMRAPIASREEAKEAEEVEEIKEEEASGGGAWVADAGAKVGFRLCEDVAYEVPIRWKAIQ